MVEGKMNKIILLLVVCLFLVGCGLGKSIANEKKWDGLSFNNTLKDTGQGDNEMPNMDQDISTNSNVTFSAPDYTITITSTGYSDYLTPYEFKQDSTYDCRDVANYSWIYPSSYNEVFNVAYLYCNQTFPGLINETKIVSSRAFSISNASFTQMRNDIITVQGNNEEIWRVTYDGDFYWKGELIDNHSDIADRYRAFFTDPEGEGFCRCSEIQEGDMEIEDWEFGPFVNDGSDNGTTIVNDGSEPGIIR